MYALVIGEEVRWGSSLVVLVISAAVIIERAFKYIIYIYNLGTLSVCLSVCVSVSSNLSHLKSDNHEIWAQYVFWANLKHYEVGFLNFDFLRGAAIYP